MNLNALYIYIYIYIYTHTFFLFSHLGNVCTFPEKYIKNTFNYMMSLLGSLLLPQISPLVTLNQYTS